MTEDEWLKTVEAKVRQFARTHGVTYAKTERIVAAAFEIGCFHSLVEYYAQTCVVEPENLKDGKFRYLTTPNGNPANFSYVVIKHKNRTYQLRQQVRVRSSIHSDIAFTPDMVVFRTSKQVKDHRDDDYAKGKRSFFFVEAADLVSFHECKSMNPFPELMVSFLGMIFAAFPWAKETDFGERIDKDSLHLAPSLFVGGSARGLHLRMVKALKASFPVNIILGMHYGTWELDRDDADLNRITDP
jgi:hypothetical protein